MKSTKRWPREFPGVNWFDRREEEAVRNVLRGGAPFRYYGVKKPRYVEAFETAAKKVYGVKYALGVSSGTGALMTAMSALGIGPGAEVVIPAFLWVSTVGAVVHAGAIPVLAEVDDSLCMDPADLEKKITPRTRLIVPVHMSGAPCDMAAIMAVARARGIAVLEDCAQANGGRFRGKALGAFGDVGMFSLQVNKNVTAGEGGLLVTDSEDLYWRMVSAHDIGALWRPGGPVSDPRYLAWGTGRRMCELVGAVASVQIRKLGRIVRHMRDSKRRIKKRLAGMPHVAFRRLNDPEGDTGNTLILLLDDAGRARRAVERINRTRPPGACRLAEAGMHIYYKIPQFVGKVPLSPAGDPWSLPQNAASVYEYGQGACPASDALFERSISLAIPSALTRAQEDFFAETVRAAVSEA